VIVVTVQHDALSLTARGLVGYGLIALAVTMVVISIVLCARWLARPGEDSLAHIKRVALRDHP
jgi:hypothetical protein